MDNDLDLFLQTITEDQILEKLGDGLTAKDRSMLVYRKEVMQTVIDGRYSGAKYLFGF